MAPKSSNKPPVSSKVPAKSGSTDLVSVGQFLERVERTVPARAQVDDQRLVFALDATMSREATWDVAASLQADMYMEAARYNGLSVQLVYFRGVREFYSSAWSNRSDELVRLMSRVTCRAGRTQIQKTLRHVLSQARSQPTKAFVLIGDAFEEEADAVLDLAGQLGMLGTKGFLFQEGRDPQAKSLFREVARLTNGAYASFDLSSASVLRDLLRAAAAYASGGKVAMDKVLADGGAAARQLLSHVPD